MTESSLLTTHSIPNHHPVTATPSLASPLPNGSLSDTNLQDEEEYTIKCICIYADDDGNTVYCPKCDTWQHIECYYHGKRVPEEHFCADCFPRDLDAKKATERQRRRREALDGGDRKVKRPSSKSQKKKHKESSATVEQVNGWHTHDRHDSGVSARDGPPAKKPKTNHRTSGSVVSVNGESRKRAASTAQSYPSPSKSPQDLFRFPAIPTYTPEFLQLYDRDEGHMNARDNEQTIQAANKLSIWRTDSSLVVNGPGHQPTGKSPFVRSNQPLDQSTLPEVSVETIRKTDVEYDGRCPTWRYLRVHASVKKDDIVGEVRGQVGMLEEYCQQKSSSNRWQELRHPDPFVFFHPHMDIYIDSRKSGTRFRYLRRSCRPNVTLKTFVSDDDETHHCFVASKDIPAGSELTTSWFLDSGMFSVDAIRDDSEQAQSRRLDWVSRVLANFGDCACEAGPACLLANFDRRIPAKTADIMLKEKGVRKKKSKNKQTVSPLSTGRATNSRAGSEPKLLDDDDQFDRRSTSESSHSGAHSRDITPATVAALDADPVLGTGLTARELRKIQMAEKAFAQKEQERKDQSNPGQQRKKKRTSGGSTLNTPTVNASKQLGHVSNSHTATPPGQSSKFNDPSLGSPPPPKGTSGWVKSTDASIRSEPKTVRPLYVSVSVQTDPEESDLPVPLAKRRKFCTPTQRLLRKLLEDRAKHGQHYPSVYPLAPDTLERHGTLAPPREDVEMKDDHPTEAFTVSPRSDGSPINVGSTTYPLPSQAAHTVTSFQHSRAPHLQLSTVPPVPAFSGSGTAGPLSAGATSSPGQGSSPMSQSSMPLILASGAFSIMSSSVATPSPARKKLSLGDYMSRRLASTPSVERSQAQAGLGESEGEASKETEQGQSSPAAPSPPTVNVRPNEGLAQQVAAQGGFSGCAVDETPVKGEADEVEFSPPNAIPLQAGTEPNPPPEKEEKMPTSTDGTGVFPAQVSQVLAQLAELKGKG